METCSHYEMFYISDNTKLHQLPLKPLVKPLASPLNIVIYFFIFLFNVCGLTSLGRYMYIETSWPRKPGDNARFNSPILKSTSSNCYLRFYYHMKGNHIGSLLVRIRTSYYSGGINSPLLNITGAQGDFWYRAMVRAPYSRDDFQFVIEGVRGSGYQGDIAIDDVSLTTGCQICKDCTMPGRLFRYMTIFTNDYYNLIAFREGKLTSYSCFPSRSTNIDSIWFSHAANWFILWSTAVCV